MTVDIIQCGNLPIIMPLWFYVKSIFADFRRSKTAILTILKALNFVFWKNFILGNVKSSQNFNIRSYSNGQNGSYWCFKMTKIDFMWNLGGKKILKFPHFVFPNRLPKSVRVGLAEKANWAKHKLVGVYLIERFKNWAF